MGKMPPLWRSSLRKEAMDLLAKIWPDLDDAGRSKLSSEIVNGPPEELMSGIEEHERASSRDRRIFDRIVAIHRVENPPLTPILENELARLRSLYPKWRAAEGEQAHFSVWVESRFGPDTEFDVDDLGVLEQEDLVDLLSKDESSGEGFVETWRQFAAAYGDRAVSALEMLSLRPNSGGAEVWRNGLWGLRDSIASGIAGRLFSLLSRVPDDLFSQPQFSQAAAQIVQAASKTELSSDLMSPFWSLFDRTLAAAATDPSNINVEDADWVFFAINRSMGYLAQAFFNELFRRNLRVGAGIPSDLAPRLDALIGADLIPHRPARVIAASRLPYLYAVDPSWVERTLLPGLDWTNEEEAVALWQGISWQARFDPQLWSAIKASFFEIFTPARIQRLSRYGRNLAQLLMLAGIEVGVDEMPRDRVRDAIRAMTKEMQMDAASWIASYVQQHAAAAADAMEESGVDAVWRERVGPWLKRVWPSDPSIRSAGISEQFALAAIATNRAFEEAVALILPYLVPADGMLVLRELLRSTHPEVRPRPTFSLIEKMFKPQAFGWRIKDMRALIDRIAISDPSIAEEAAFRRWNGHLKTLETAIPVH